MSTSEQMGKVLDTLNSTFNYHFFNYAIDGRSSSNLNECGIRHLPSHPGGLEKLHMHKKNLEAFRTLRDKLRKIGIKVVVNRNTNFTYDITNNKFSHPETLLSALRIVNNTLHKHKHKKPLNFTEIMDVCNQLLTK